MFICPESYYYTIVGAVVVVTVW